MADTVIGCGKVNAPPASAPTLEGVRAALAAFGRAHPQIERITVFGSVARGQATAQSDVDVVVRFAPGSLPHGLDGFAFLDDLKGGLARELGCPVDLVTACGVESSTRMGFRALGRAVARDGQLAYERTEPERTPD